MASIPAPSESNASASLVNPVSTTLSINASDMSGDGEDTRPIRFGH